ncbi:hypothetical protein MUP65_00775 [Patescibacteria group bacterium]|nr:hypothetical protein [Patescibacteria group bacterium]
MKRLKTALLFLLVVFLTLPVVLSSRAQEPNPELAIALANYEHTYERYRLAHNDYELAKSQYRAYNNLTSQTTALTKTAIMLEARDQVMIIFLHLIGTKLSTETKFTFGKVSVILQKLTNEADWYLEHQSKISSAATIEDLLAISQEAEERFDYSSQIVYEALFEGFIAEETEIMTLVQLELTQLNGLIQEIRQTDQDTSSIERWQIETENKFELARQKFTQADEFDAYLPKDGAGPNFSRHTLMLEQTNQYLKETNLNIIEIIREIKYVN